MISDLVLHLRYHRWASRLALEAARRLSPEERARALESSFPGVLGTLSHLYFADLVWFARLKGEPGPARPEALALEALEGEWLPLLDRYVAWAESLDERGWNRAVAYKDLAGRSWETPVRQIILHLVNHGSYHRGQLATLLRQLGRTPPQTDLIAYYRTLASAAAV